MMDPVPRSKGFRYNKQRADIVTLSHHHEGHTATEMVSTEFKLVDGPGEYEISDVFITGTRTYHDDQRGALKGRNTVYVVEVEGTSICHLGDIGHELTDEQAEAISSVDVLLIPVGGGPGPDASRAVAIINQIEPSVVIPIQYRTDFADQELDSVDKFLQEMGVSDIKPLEKLNVRRSSGSDPGTSVVVLECSASGR